MYGGIALLIGASVWNTWPKRNKHHLVRPVAGQEIADEVQLSKRRFFKMANKRKVEVFSAGCPACQDTVALVQRVACPSCEVSVLDMKDPKVASRAKALGIRSVPAVVIDGKLADCCAGRGPQEATLRAAGLGVA
jgi:glutaredoxin